MRGLSFDGVGRVSYRTDLAEPTIRATTDTIVAVSHAGLCGSDLHPYEGREPARPHVIPGHEAVGEVVTVGTDVHTHAIGDRVLVPFTTSCAACPSCTRGLTARCRQGQLFGWGPPDGSDDTVLHGAQTELLRVPLADGTLVRVPVGLDVGTALLLTDNLPTAWEAVRRAAPLPGDALVVVGLGSVGLCAIVAAIDAGAEPVIGIDPVADRRERATRLGAAVVTDPTAARETVAEFTTAKTSGSPWHEPGVACVVEAAGTASAQRTAFELLRPGGTLSIISVQTAADFAFSPIDAYDRNLTVRAGRASVRRTLRHLLPRVLGGEVPSPAPVIMTHLDVPLEEGAELYRRFAARADGLVKASFAI